MNRPKLHLLALNQIFLPILFILVACVLPITKSIAQPITGDTIFYEGFKTLAWPIGWLRFNLDGNVPQPSSSMAGNQWIIVRPYNDTTKRVVWNGENGFFGAPVPGNDWFITPTVILNSKSYDLLWDAASTVSPSYPFGQGYKLWICDANCQIISQGNVETAFSNLAMNITNEKGIVPQNSQMTRRRISLNNFRNKSVRFAIQHTDSMPHGLYFDNFLVRELPLHDLQIAAIKPPRIGCGLKSNEKVFVNLRNNGAMDASNFVVRLYLNNNLLETRQIDGPWAQERLDSISFVVNMSQKGEYQFRAEVTYTPDTTLGNNTLTLNYNHRPPINLNTSAFAEKFTGTEWLKNWNVEDANGDGFTWGQSTVLNINSCTYPSKTPEPSNTQTGNDWVMNGCFLLEKDSAYILNYTYKWDFFLGIFFSTFLGNKPTKDSMLTSIDYVAAGSPAPSVPLLRKKTLSRAFISWDLKCM